MHIPWKELAACKHVQPLFYANSRSARGQKAIREAKKLCAECPVKQECYNFAVSMKEEHGVWGGVDFAEENREVRRNRARKYASQK